ncbi:MAG: hypothetical protein LC118_04450, partial [Dehalococcoidia bacterium]|nr:hypothetical protein [Dehalococcoidia bacterium]
MELSIEEADEYAIGERSAALVYKESLDDMKSKSIVTSDGCWLAPTAGPVPCRCDGDGRPDGELPKMAAHRWTWSIANGYAHRPFSGAFVKVRHRCGSGMCCNP